MRTALPNDLPLMKRGLGRSSTMTPPKNRNPTMQIAALMIDRKDVISIYCQIESDRFARLHGIVVDDDRSERLGDIAERNPRFPIFHDHVGRNLARLSNLELHVDVLV